MLRRCLSSSGSTPVAGAELALAAVGAEDGAALAAGVPSDLGATSAGAGDEAEVVVAGSSVSAGRLQAAKLTRIIPVTNRKAVPPVALAATTAY